MPRQNPLIIERGFIALYALLSLAFMVGMAVLVMAHWDGINQRLRQQGGEAQAQRVAAAFIEERLAMEWASTPRPWIPALRGEQAYGAAVVTWRRIPLEGRWRAGARPWMPEWREAWDRLGARPERSTHWQGWMERRQAQVLNAALGRGDLVMDRRYLGGIFEDLGLAYHWQRADRLWTTDEGGALNRLNLLGADAEALALLSGVAKERIAQFQTLAGSGFADAGAAHGYWRFDEQQALERWASVRPFSVALFEVEVALPTLKQPISTSWRVSQEDGTPGNPWFRVQPWSRELW